MVPGIVWHWRIMNTGVRDAGNQEKYGLSVTKEGVKVYVAVHVDDEWFQREDGTEYNEDVVTLDEFLENVEYPVYGKEACIGQLGEKAVPDIS